MATLPRKYKLLPRTRLLPRRLLRLCPRAAPMALHLHFLQTALLAVRRQRTSPKKRVKKRQVHFVANCVYADHVAGGDIHFFNMAQATTEAGYPLHFYGGHALEGHVQRRKLNATLTLTDRRQAGGINMERLSGQIRLFNDYRRRL